MLSNSRSSIGNQKYNKGIMAAETAQIAASLESLTLHAFEAFCEDIASMFGNVAECTAECTGQGKVDDLKKEFKKLASVNQVRTQGILDGTFQLLLDQAGLFVLAGVFVMLPEKRILETIRNGTLKDADYINDAIKEVGNLLVGSWDRIFRDEMQGHKHLKQTGTFVGSLWDDSQLSIGLATDQPCRHVICRMKVDNFPEFKCAAVFSDSLFEPKNESASTQEIESAAPSETKTPEEPTPAPAAAEPKPVSEEKTVPPAAEPVAEVVTQHSDASEPEAAPAPAEPESTSEDKIEPASAPEPITTEQKPGPVAEAIRQLTRHADTANPATSPSHEAAPLPGLTAGQILSQAALWIDPEETIEEVLRQMQQQNVSYVLVGRDGQIDGLVSRSDIAAAISPYTRSVFAHWRRPLDDATLQIRVKWFMSRPVHTIRPDASMIDVMESMMRHAVRGLPVVDTNGRTLGVLTVYDVFAALLGSAGVSVTGCPQQAPPGVK